MPAPDVPRHIPRKCSLTVSRWLLLAGLASGLVALATGHLLAKLAVPFCCALALAAQAGAQPAPWRVVAPVIVALAFALVGDFFLSSRAGRVSWFVAGITAYLVAHLGYLTFALRHGRLHRVTLVFALLAILAYYGLALAPRLSNVSLSVSVLAYSVVSVVSLAAAIGLHQRAAVKSCFVAGISLLVFSDTAISFSEFCRWRAWNGLILPTYYLALLLIATGVLEAARPRAGLPTTVGGAHSPP